MATIETLTSAHIDPKVLRAAGPVALDFYDETCPPCRVLEPRLERVAEQYAGRVPVYRVDVQQDPAAAQRFGVMSIPTVLVFRAGAVVERLDGLIREADVRAAFDRVGQQP